MTPESSAQRLWTAARTDTILLRNLRANYRGRFDVRDALWWRANPLTPTPAGRPDPATELAALQSAVYSRTPARGSLVDFVDTASGRTVRGTEEEHRLRELAPQLEQDARDLDAALAASRDATLDASPDAARSHRAAPHRGRHRGLRLLAAAATAALLTTVGVHALEGHSTLRGASTASASDSPGPDTTSAAWHLTRDFEGTSAVTAQEALLLGPQFRPDSIRRVATGLASDSGYALYIAEHNSGRHCIVTRTPDGTGSTVCAARGTIAETGLILKTVVRRALPGGANAHLVIELQVSWWPDGSVTAHPSPRSR